MCVIKHRVSKKGKHKLYRLGVLHGKTVNLLYFKSLPLFLEDFLAKGRLASISKCQNLNTVKNKLDNAAKTNKKSQMQARRKKIMNFDCVSLKKENSYWPVLADVFSGSIGL